MGYLQSYDKNETGLRNETSVMSELIRKVYLWMAAALCLTGLTAYWTATNTAVLQLIFSNSLVFWGLAIGELALVFILSAAIQRLSFGAATAMFIVYSVINGLTMSSIFLVYTYQSIASVFFITAGMFGVMAVYGYFTKTDLTSMGKILFMALIGIIIATVVNIFLKSDTLSMIVSYIGVVIFVGLTAYDSQKIKMMMSQAEAVDDTTKKYALLGALSLYLDFINLFLYLLRILGGRRN